MVYRHPSQILLNENEVLKNEIVKLKRENELLKKTNKSYFVRNNELNEKLSKLLDKLYTVRYDLDHFYELEKTESEHSWKNRQFKKQFEHIKEIMEIIG